MSENSEKCMWSLKRCIPETKKNNKSLNLSRWNQQMFDEMKCLFEKKNDASVQNTCRVIYRSTNRCNNNSYCIAGIHDIDIQV